VFWWIVIFCRAYLENDQKGSRQRKSIPNGELECTTAKSSLRRSKQTYHLLYLESRIKRYQFCIVTILRATPTVLQNWIGIYGYLPSLKIEWQAKYIVISKSFANWTWQTQFGRPLYYFSTTTSTSAGQDQNCTAQEHGYTKTDNRNDEFFSTVNTTKAKEVN